jgi:hypothetical protein
VLAIGISLYAASRWRHRRNNFPLIMLACISVAISAILMPYRIGGSAAITQEWYDAARQISFKLHELAVFVRSPHDWNRAMEGRQRQAADAVKAISPLPPLEGTVDSIPNIQSDLIANGLKFQPRFTVQEYVDYTRALIERNRASLTGEGAAKYLFFRPGSIDNRHPALAEGPLWPDLLRFYEPDRLVGDMLLLRRRALPAGDIFSSSERRVANIREVIAIPRGVPLLLKADIRPRLRGSLLNLLFKTPPGHISVLYADGTTASYRLIPAIAREGFIISPLVSSSSTYAFLALGRLDLVRKWPVEIRFDFDPQFYRTDIAL